MKGIIGKKVGMTSVFADGKQTAVTVIEAGPCVITQIKTQEVDGYVATQLAFDDKKDKATPKPLQGHFKKAGTTPKRKVVEFRDYDFGKAVGELVLVTAFEEGDFINVIGTSKGKGFQGVVKRHGFTGLGPGNYVLLVTDANGCSGTTSFVISAPSQISVDLGVTEQYILTGMSTQLIATATSTLPILSYIWVPDSLMDYSLCADAANCSTPYAAPRTTTVFTVTVMNADSCYASDTITVYVSNELSKFIPSAFTPNGDGLNDRFEFDVLGATNLDIAVFNRWGQKIFADPAQPNGITGNNGWDGKVDGKVAPFDTYVWKLKVT